MGRRLSAHRSSRAAGVESRNLMSRTFRTSAFAQEEPEDTRYLLRRRIPLKSLTSLQGEGGGGKSTFLRWLAARVSRGELDGDLEGPANVLWLNVEEHVRRDIRPGLDRQGADVTRIFRPDNSVPLLRFPKDLERLHDTVVERSARLVVIDQVNAFVGSAEAAIREALAGLCKIADDCDCAIVGSRNLNGNKAADMYRRGRGGGLFIDICRANFHLGRHPDDAGDIDGRRVLVFVKGNIHGPKPPTLVFTTDPSGRVVIGDEIDLQSNGLFARPDGEARLALAIVFLREFLDGREVPTQEMLAAAGTRGHSLTTVDRARAVLGVLPRRVTVANPDGTTRQQSVLRLPGFLVPDEAPEPIPPPAPAPTSTPTLTPTIRPAVTSTAVTTTGPDDSTIRFSLVELDTVDRVERVDNPASANGVFPDLPGPPSDPGGAP